MFRGVPGISTQLSRTSESALIATDNDKWHSHLYSTCGLPSPSPDPGALGARGDCVEAWGGWGGWHPGSAGGARRAEQHRGSERLRDWFTVPLTWGGMPASAFSPEASVPVLMSIPDWRDFWISSSKRHHPRARLPRFSVCQRAWDLGEGLSTHLSAIHSTSKCFPSAYLVPGSVFTLELRGSLLPDQAF